MRSAVVTARPWSLARSPLQALQRSPPDGRLQLSFRRQGRVLVALDAFGAVPDGFGVANQPEAGGDFRMDHGVRMPFNFSSIIP
jgi:hypothetical protein